MEQARHVHAAEYQLRSVLPFEAVPAGLLPLRKAVRAQLMRWGMPAVSHEAELATTELATNVIQHVGEGAPAIIVMEVSGHRALRIEAHDKSRESPRVSGAECWAEHGRGLQLLAGVALDWGVLLTATGKAVWCEISLDHVQHCTRVRRAAAVAEEYRRAAAGDQVLVEHSAAAREAVTHVICDLLHWISAQGEDSDSVLDQALMLYEAEAGLAA
ncbi:ATP-binding protein [Streptomyces sp. SID8367]|nr:ATP-binding protein [Streptomyces sp. SID8367]